ncbi:GIY-YIG nuclease family protein [Flavobacterium sp.]|uniref:GIY-YIG nuclease family protein n=2 Tax=Flavobacterium sp. TaxID=239 RepID=UPI004047A548
MTLNDFTNKFEQNFKATFTGNFTEEVITYAFQNKVKTTNLCFKNEFGIYIFFIKSDLKWKDYKDLEQKWKEKDFIKIPKAIKGNYDKSLLIENYIPFYIGKSENILKRVKEHLEHDKSKATYGMKLANRKHFKLSDFEIGYWQLDLDPSFSKEIKQFIITTIEQKIREKLKPLIGKK